MTRGGGLSVAARRRRVHELRDLEWTVRQISAELGVGVATVHRDLAVPVDGTPDADGTPAVPSPPKVWVEPGQPGNLLALKHGAHSERIIRPRVALIVAELLEGPTTAYLRDPSYRLQVEAYGEARAKVELLDEWLALHGELDEDGEPRPALAELRRWTKRQSEAAARLGLDPLSRARLRLDDVGARLDLARLWAEEQKVGVDVGEDG